MPSDEDRPVVFVVVFSMHLNLRIRRYGSRCYISHMELTLSLIRTSDLSNYTKVDRSTTAISPNQMVHLEPSIRRQRENYVIVKFPKFTSKIKITAPGVIARQAAHGILQRSLVSKFAVSKDRRLLNAKKKRRGASRYPVKSQAKVRCTTQKMYNIYTEQKASLSTIFNIPEPRRAQTMLET